MTEQVRDLTRMLKQANESIKYWEARYDSLARDIRDYLQTRKELGEARQNLERLVEHV